jgi:hypothetical protein
MAGAKRTPLSGGAGGNDISFEPDSLWSAFGWECKRPARMPVFVTKALDQAQAALPIGSVRCPAVAMREDHGRTVVCWYWDDIRTFVEALAEAPRQQELKATIRQMRKQLDEMERLLR